MHPQQNPLAVQHLLFVPRFSGYSAEHLQAVDRVAGYQQGWIERQANRTYRVLPTKRIDIPFTNAEIATQTSNFYHWAQNWLLANPRFDSTRQRINFCNWRRLYVLHCVGSVPGLGNMGGRQAWQCAPAPDNPLEPWGPGVAAGFSAWSLELLRGREQPAIDAGMEILDSAGLYLYDKSIGAALHEMLQDRK